MSNPTITDKDIKTAKAFAKVHARIVNEPTKSLMTAERMAKRVIRASKIWRQMFAYRLEG